VGYVGKEGRRGRWLKLAALVRCWRRLEGGGDDEYPKIK
jgi:hypothetical protein